MVESRYYKTISIGPNNGSRAKSLQLVFKVNGGKGEAWLCAPQIERGPFMHAYMPAEMTSTRIGPGVIETYNISTKGLNAEVVKTGTLNVTEGMSIQGSAGNWNLSNNKLTAIGNAAFELKTANTGARIEIMPTNITGYKDDGSVGYKLNSDGSATFSNSIDITAGDGDVKINNLGITISGPKGLNLTGSGSIKLASTSGGIKFYDADTEDWIDALTIHGINAEAIKVGKIYSKSDGCRYNYC